MRTGFLDFISVIILFSSCGGSFPDFENPQAAHEYMLDLAADGKILKIDSIIRKYDLDVNYTNENGDTAALLAAKNGRRETLFILVKRGASTDLKNGEGKTLLHYAAEVGNIDMVKFLLSNDVSVEVYDNNGDSPVEIAYEKGYDKIMEILVKELIDEKNWTIYHIAAITGNLETIMQQIFSSQGIIYFGVGTVFDKDNDGCTPDFYAVSSGHKNIVNIISST